MMTLLVLIAITAVVLLHQWDAATTQETKPAMVAVKAKPELPQRQRRHY